MAALATKVALHAIKLGTDKVPDKYWERIPGMRPPKDEQEYKEQKAKIDKHECEDGRYGSDRRHRDDRRDDERHHDHGSRRRSADRHRSRRRSQSDERRGNERRRNREGRSDRQRLERRASSYSPPPPLDDEFYNDAERMRQARRAHKYHCNDPAHQQWERRESPAYMARPYIQMPQVENAPSPYVQPALPGSAGGPSPAPTFNPSAYPTAVYSQQTPLPRPPQGLPPSQSQPQPQVAMPIANPYVQSPPDSRRVSVQLSPHFSPQVSSPYMPASAANSRPVSQQADRPVAPPFQQHNYPPPPPISATATQPVPTQQQQQQQQQPMTFPPPPARTPGPSRSGTPGIVSPAPYSVGAAASSSKAAQKYTPQGVALGNPMYASQ